MDKDEIGEDNLIEKRAKVPPLIGAMGPIESTHSLNLQYLSL